MLLIGKCFFFATLVCVFLTTGRAYAWGNLYPDQIHADEKLNQAVLRQWKLPEVEQGLRTHHAIVASEDLSTALVLRLVDDKRFEIFLLSQSGDVIPLDFKFVPGKNRFPLVQGDMMHSNLDRHAAYHQKSGDWLVVSGQSIYRWNQEGALVYNYAISELAGKSIGILSAVIWSKDGSKLWVRGDQNLNREMNQYADSTIHDQEDLNRGAKSRWWMFSISDQGPPLKVWGDQEVAPEANYVSLQMDEKYLYSDTMKYYDANTGQWVSDPRVLVYLPWLHDRAGLSNTYHNFHPLLQTNWTVQSPKAADEDSLINLTGVTKRDRKSWRYQQRVEHEKEGWQRIMYWPVWAWYFPVLVLLIFTAGVCLKWRWCQYSRLYTLLAALGVLCLLLGLPLLMIQGLVKGPRIQSVLINRGITDGGLQYQVWNTTNVFFSVDMNAADEGQYQVVVVHLHNPLRNYSGYYGWNPTRHYLGLRALDVQQDGTKDEFMISSVRAFAGNQESKRLIFLDAHQQVRLVDLNKLGELYQDQIGAIPPYPDQKKWQTKNGSESTD